MFYYMKNKECFYSSFIFLFNALIAYKYGYYNYSLSFLFLTITSLIHHYYDTKFTYNLDRIALIIIFYYTVSVFYIKFKNNIIKYEHIILYIILFFYMSYLYIYGYYNNQYCFDTNHNLSCCWHSLLHIIASVSHIILILL